HAQANDSEPSPIVDASPIPARPQTDAVQTPEVGLAPAPVPVSLVKSAPASNSIADRAPKEVKSAPASNSIADRAPKEIKAVYTEWADSAARGDWPKHMSFYADRVEYFRDGVTPKTKIETRKRKIFDGLTSYKLHFSDPPQVMIEGDRAEVSFDREWQLCHGRKCNGGQARGTITLRRQGTLWRIVSEKQIKK